MLYGGVEIDTGGIDDRRIEDEYTPLATFSSEQKAEAYVAASRLQKPTRDHVYRADSLLRPYRFHKVEPWYHLPHDPICGSDTPAEKATTRTRAGS